jgi:hypothetical protein
VEIRVAGQPGVRSCSHATDVHPAIACGGSDPLVGMKGKRLLRNNRWMFQACELGLPLQGYEIRFRIAHFSRGLRLLDPFAT